MPSMIIALIHTNAYDEDYWPTEESASRNPVDIIMIGLAKNENPITRIIYH
jgi:hypothetical protein